MSSCNDFDELIKGIELQLDRHNNTICMETELIDKVIDRLITDGYKSVSCRLTDKEANSYRTFKNKSKESEPYYVIEGIRCQKS